VQKNKCYGAGTDTGTGAGMGAGAGTATGRGVGVGPGYSLRLSSLPLDERIAESVNKFVIKRIIADRAMLDGCEMPAPGQYTPGQGKSEFDVAAARGSVMRECSPGRAGYKFSRAARRTAIAHEVGAVEAVSAHVKWAMRARKTAASSVPAPVPVPVHVPAAALVAENISAQ
jgi:hypothetical protein